jgi:hypothetical protein
MFRGHASSSYIYAVIPLSEMEGMHNTSHNLFCRRFNAEYENKIDEIESLPRWKLPVLSSIQESLASRDNPILKCFLSKGCPQLCWNAHGRLYNHESIVRELAINHLKKFDQGHVVRVLLHKTAGRKFLIASNGSMLPCYSVLQSCVERLRDSSWWCSRSNDMNRSFLSPMVPIEATAILQIMPFVRGHVPIDFQVLLSLAQFERRWSTNCNAKRYCKTEMQ